MIAASYAGSVATCRAAIEFERRGWARLTLAEPKVRLIMNGSIIGLVLVTILTVVVDAFG
jgi:hypothetical protein